MIMTAELARETWSYDPEDGHLRWRKKIGPFVEVGAVAGTVTRRGYVEVKAYGRNHMAHRIIWLLVYGRWPPEHIDHINRNPTDNRLVNLREVFGEG
jgi:hypothetical protein